MSYIATNLVAILAATCAGLGIGALYGLARRTPENGLPGRRAQAGLVLVAAIAEFWLASILAGALILAPSEAGPWTMAIASAVVIWIGFVVPVLVVTNQFQRMGAREAILNCGHWLAVMVAQAAVLHAIGLVKPG